MQGAKSTPIVSRSTSEAYRAMAGGYAGSRLGRKMLFRRSQLVPLSFVRLKTGSHVGLLYRYHPYVGQGLVLGCAALACGIHAATN